MTRLPYGLAPLALFGAALLCACASPREHLYTLDAASHDEPNEADRAARPTVVVGPVSVPESIDRPQLVVREGAYGLAAAEQQRWAAPLKEMLPRVFALELSRQIPQRRFVAASSAAINVPLARLAIDIARLDLDATAGADIVAHWIYRPADPNAAVIEADASVHARLAGAGTQALIDALRRAGTDLADKIAARLSAP